ncbi:hypothetical protein A3L11_04355 [Thermococcus siculi]|uniref:Uncharacterized protein n=1 Tax=Thermococcus siculi TaxID=72803 RepID=A0A2Z2MWF3_9EURY|nr:hypothetical protein [Thermococcus siculi]ASJ08503.1 hypothetical protein A3L11_04355 [Thermococcus siculi]
MKKVYLLAFFLIFLLITGIYYSRSISMNTRPIPDLRGDIAVYGRCEGTTELAPKLNLWTGYSNNSALISPFDYWYQQLAANVSAQIVNVTPEMYLSLVRTNSEEYRNIKLKMKSYVKTLRGLEFKVSDPNSYALLAWLEFLVGDGTLELPNINENTTNVTLERYIWAKIAPRYYNNYVFPYLDSKIAELENSGSDGIGLGVKVKVYLNQSVPQLDSNLSRLEGRVWWAKKGRIALQYSISEYERGYYALALLDYSYALSYYRVSQSLPNEKYVVNSSAVDDIISETFKKLHQEGVFWLDPIFVMRLLPELKQFQSLCTEIDADSQQYEKYKLYLMALELKTETLGFLIWHDILHEITVQS